MRVNLIPPAMNTKKLIFGLLTVGILSGAACTSDNSDVYEQSVKKSDIRISNKQSVKKSDIRISNKQSVKKSDVRISNKQKKE